MGRSCDIYSAKPGTLIKTPEFVIGVGVAATFMAPGGGAIAGLKYQISSRSPLVPIEQSQQHTENKMANDILEKRSPGGQFGQFPTSAQRVIGIDKRSQPPRREQKQLPKTSSFEPVWARQEPFEDRSIEFGQHDAIEEMNTPGEQGKSIVPRKFTT